MTMSDLAIETQDLVRTYRTRKSAGNPSGAPVVALDGVTLDIPPGEFFGLLGPNGAGKTTFIKVLVTLLLPTSGSARVAGFDVVGQAQQVRERISMVSGGEHSGYGLLTVREQLWMFSQFYGMPTRTALARIDQLLRVVGLDEERSRRVAPANGGRDVFYPPHRAAGRHCLGEPGAGCAAGGCAGIGRPDGAAPAAGR